MSDMPLCVFSKVTNFLSDFINNIKYIWDRFCLNGLLCYVQAVLLKTMSVCVFVCVYVFMLQETRSTELQYTVVVPRIYRNG